MLITTKELREIESVLAERLKVDYSNFSDDFFRRRLTYVFDKMHYHRVQDLYEALGSLVTFDTLSYYLSVPQTELFRQPSFWRRLVKHLAESHAKTIWLACLTSYHELFSLLIAADLAGRHDLKIVANVLSDKISNECRSLCLSKKDDKQNRINFERLESQASYDDYVSKTADGFALRPGMVEGVTFRNGWFVNEPDEKYDIVICRDVMLTYNEELQKKAVAKLADSLDGRGSILALGVMERPLGHEDDFDSKWMADGIYGVIE